MANFDSISKKLALVNTMCQFFMRVVKLFVFCFVIFFVYNFVTNNKYSVSIDSNLNTTIISPNVITLEGANYHIISDKGTFIEDGHYDFDNVKIINDNIDIFTNKLDFYSNNNEIVLKDRPVIIFNGNNSN